MPLYAIFFHNIEQLLRHLQLSYWRENAAVLSWQRRQCAWILGRWLQGFDTQTKNASSPVWKYVEFKAGENGEPKDLNGALCCLFFKELWATPQIHLVHRSIQFAWLDWLSKRAMIISRDGSDLIPIHNGRYGYRIQHKGSFHFNIFIIIVGIDVRLHHEAKINTLYIDNGIEFKCIPKEYGWWTIPGLLSSNRLRNPTFSMIYSGLSSIMKLSKVSVIPLAFGLSARTFFAKSVS